LFVRIMRGQSLRHPLDETTEHTAYWQGACLILLGWALVVNIAPSMLPWAPKYGGVRLFLPMFPYLAVMAGVGFFWLSQRIIERGKDNWGAEFDNFPVKLRIGLALRWWWRSGIVTPLACRIIIALSVGRVGRTRWAWSRRTGEIATWPLWAG